MDTSIHPVEFISHANLSAKMYFVITVIDLQMTAEHGHWTWTPNVD